jgi:hypothetical protein
MVDQASGAQVGVKVGAKSDTGSNKPGKYLVQLTARAYTHKRASGYQVAVLKPKLDRLSVTFPVDDEDARKAIRHHLAQLAASDAQPVTVWKKASDWGSQKYDRSYRLEVTPKASVLVQCASAKSSVSLLRFEFNPDQISPGGVHAFRQAVPLLTAGHYDYQALACCGRVSRIDIAVDLVNIDIEDMLIATAKPSATSGYFGVTGKAETKYLNQKKGGSKLYVYDRRARLEKLHAEGKGEPSEFGEAKYTRVEIRTEANIPIVDIPNMSNRLLKLNIFDIDAAAPPEQLHHWRLFQDSCRYRGLAGALALLPGEAKGAYKNAIMMSEPLWRPNELWSHWPAVVNDSGLLPSANASCSDL